MRKYQSDRDIITLLTLVFIGVLVFVFFSFVCDNDAESADLSTKADMQTAVYMRIQATSSNNFWDTLKIQEAINRAMNFVEFHTKANISVDTIRLNPDVYFYQIPSAAACDGVLRVLRVNSVNGELEALTKRDVTEFGKADFMPQSIYSVIGDSLMIYKIPDVTDLLYVFSWKQTSDLDTGTSVIGLPLAYRRMILDMAVGECARMAGDVGTWNAVRQAITQEIYGLPPEPAKQSQPLGIEGKP